MVQSLERAYMFGHNSLRLPCKQLVLSLMSGLCQSRKDLAWIKKGEISRKTQTQLPSLVPISAICNGWQAFFDAQTQVITPYHDLSKLDDKDWARYFSNLIKGKHILMPGAVDALWKKVKDNAFGKLPTFAAKLLIDCLIGHHKDDPAASIGIAFQIALFLQGRMAH